MKTELPPPLSGVEKQRVKRTYTRRRWGRIRVDVAGEEWEFTMRADGLHGKRTGLREKPQVATWHEVMDACVQQRRLPLV